MDMVSRIVWLSVGCTGFVVQNVKLWNSPVIEIEQDHYVQSSSSSSSFVVNEVSGCRFLSEDLSELVLVSDKGRLFFARLDVNDMKISFERAVDLKAPGFEAVDAEGCAVDSKGRLYVSTEKNTEDSGRESLLSVLEVNATTGVAVETAGEFAIPAVVREQVTENEGFESLTTTTALGGEHLLTTTEYRLNVDKPGVHGILAWDVEQRNEVEYNIRYVARNDTVTDTPSGVVDFASLNSTLLVLERGFRPDGYNVIHLFEVQFVLADDRDSDTTRKRELFELSNRTLNVSISDGVYQVDADNYEGLCLLPGSSTLLLVSDNDARRQTRFLLLDLEVEGLQPYSPPTSSSSSSGSSKSKAEGSSLILWLLPLLALLVFLAACVAWRKRNYHYAERGVESAADLEPSEIEFGYREKYRDDDRDQHHAGTGPESSTFI